MLAPIKVCQVVSVRQGFGTEVYSVDDDPAAQAFDDYRLVCDAVLYASNVKLDINNPFANAFPGDHYRLLAGLIHFLNPKKIVDIGTHYGTGTRVMLDFAPFAEVDTFDLLAWDSFETTFLKESDFKTNGGRLTQHLADLSDEKTFAEYSDLLSEAEFIMVDGPKDSKFEQKFYEKFGKLSFKTQNRWLFIDDTRFKSELMNWRRILNPKIDLSSFGHFSGTGLVEASEGFKFA